MTLSKVVGDLQPRDKKVTNWITWSWWFQTLIIFTPTWGDDPIWLGSFQIGLKPPTRYRCRKANVTWDNLGVHEFRYRRVVFYSDLLIQTMSKNFPPPSLFKTSRYKVPQSPQDECAKSSHVFLSFRLSTNRKLMVWGPLVWDWNRGNSLSQGDPRNPNHQAPNHQLIINH